MLRTLSNIGAIAAALGCMALAVLWARSFRVWDKLVVSWPAEGMGIASASGIIVINVQLTDEVTDLPRPGWSSAPPNLWSVANSQTWIGGDEPLPISVFRLRFRTNQQFECKTVVGDLPDLAWLGPDTVLFLPAAGMARPVVGDRFLRIKFPHWAPVAALATLCVARLYVLILRRVQRQWRIAHERCRTCGYDLRATPEMCPECGTAATLAQPRDVPSGA